MSSKAIVWIREDFRINLNPALSNACQNHNEVTALYIFNPKNFIKVIPIINIISYTALF